MGPDVLENVLLIFYCFTVHAYCANESKVRHVVSTFAARDESLHGALIVNRRNEKLNSALAMAGLATEVHAVFAVVVALGGPRTTPGPANLFSPTARATKTLRGRCAAIWPDLQLDLGRGRAGEREICSNLAWRCLRGVP